MNAFNNKMTLYNQTISYGTAPNPQRTNIKTVWCFISEVGSTVAFNALAAGVKLNKQVEMWAAEYGDRQYALINGVTYKVEQAVRTGNDLKIKLLLSRG